MMKTDWIKKQTLLVEHQKKMQYLESQKSALQTEQTILEQKKMRLNTKYLTHEKGIKKI